MNDVPVGKHCILELHGCSPDLLDDPAFVRDAVRQAADEGLSTLLRLVSHRFEPHGVTAIGLLAESHLSIHTWPEHGYAAVDLFTCGTNATPEWACRFLARRFGALASSLRVLHRGGDPALLEADADGVETDAAVSWRHPGRR